MKKLFLACSILLLMLPAFAQKANSVIEAEIDSLRSRANELRQSNPSESIKNCQQALELLSTHSNSSKEAAVYNIMGLANIYLSNFKISMECFSKALVIYEASKSNSKIADTYNFIGIAYKEKDMYDSALVYFMKSLEIKERWNLESTLASSYHNIAIIYRHKGNYEKALEFYRKSEHIKLEREDITGLIKTYNNMALVYSHMNDMKASLEYYDKVLNIANKMNDRVGIADAHSGIGSSLKTLAERDMENGDTLEAHRKLKEALAYYERTEQFERSRHAKKDLSGVLCNTGNIHFLLKDYEKANRYYFEALSLSREANQIEFTRNVYHGLWQTFEAKKDYETALAYHKLFKEMGDSLFNLNSTDIIASWQARYETEIKDNKIRELNSTTLIQAYKMQSQQSQLAQEQLALEKRGQEIKLLNQDKEIQLLNLHEKEHQLNEQKLVTESQMKEVKLLQKDREMREAVISRQKVVRGFLIAGTVLVFLFFVALANRYRVINRQKKIITREKERSESLLLNILPSEVAEELKQKGEAKAQMFDEVTVLFSDFKNFTKVSERLTPEELVAELNVCFKAFDEIMEKHGVEKIKTVGDAYMAASGLPSANPSHAEDAVKAAIQMQRFMEKRHSELGDRTFQMRIGLHSGKVVAGIVGVKKFAYDIWGDTVNTAARMEQNGEPGKVNISEATYELVKDKFYCDYRGEIEAKNKGKLHMYFVTEQAPVAVESFA